MNISEKNISKQYKPKPSHLYTLFFSLFSIVLHLNAQVIVPTNGCSVTESFDNTNSWTFGGSNSSWIWGNPNKQDVTDDISGGGKSLILGGNSNTSTYNQNEDSWAESPDYNLSLVGSPYIEFWFYWSNEGSTTYDEIWMEYSLNGGGSWSNLSTPIGSGSCFDQNWYNYPSNWGGNNGGCFSGLGGPNGWVLVRKCLPVIANQPQVKFRFRISTGTSCENFGATIDDFRVCDAHLNVDARFSCTPIPIFPLLVDFTDLSEPCPDQWLWNFGDGITSSLQNPTHSYASAGTYVVSLTSSVVGTGGCGSAFSGSHSFIIEVLDVSITNFSNISCIGANDGTATASVIGNTGTVSYNWSPSPTTGQGTPSIAGLASNTYSITATPVNEGCPATSSVTMNEPIVVTNNFTITDESCGGQCDGAVAASLSGGALPYSSVQWLNPNVTGNSLNNICAGNYDLEVIDANACIFIFTASVLTAPVPSIDPVSDLSVCEDEIIGPINFSGSASNYNWQVINSVDLGFGLTGSGVTLPQVSAINSTTSTLTSVFVVTPSSGSFCVGANDTFQIDVYPKTDVRFSADINSGCAPLEVIYTNHSSPSNYFGTWFFGDGHTFTSISDSIVSHIYDGGEYDVTLTQTTTMGCISSATYNGLISASPQPIAEFSYTPTPVTKEDDWLQFYNHSSYASKFIWYLNDKLFSIEEQPKYALATVLDNSMEIMLIVLDDEDCSDTSLKVIQIENEFRIYLPNSFSPNGDSKNDVFAPVFSEGNIPKDYKLSIYNRWGEIVFITKNHLEAWSGVKNLNEHAIQGVYIYELEFQNSQTNQYFNKKGHIILIR